MKIIVRVTPVQGDSRQVEVEADATTLGNVLKKAKINPKNMNVSLNGNPVADMNTVVSSGATVSLTEKTRGS